jgi:hypothetical protein
MHTSTKRRWIVYLTLPAVAALSLVAVVVSRASTPAGCDPVDSAIVESEKFTPFEERRSQLPDPVINPSGEEAPPIPADALVSSIDELPLRWAVVSEGGSVYQYYLGTEIEPDLTLSEFFAAGGLEFDRDPADNSESFAEQLLDTLGERAIKVEIGEDTGALVWTDPQINGVRPHHLYWTDGDWNYVLMADMSPERIVELGRDLVCGGE